jgi:hypothetical protein
MVFLAFVVEKRRSQFIAAELALYKFFGVFRAFVVAGRARRRQVLTGTVKVVRRED